MHAWAALSTTAIYRAYRAIILATFTIKFGHRSKSILMEREGQTKVEAS